MSTPERYPPGRYGRRRAGRRGAVGRWLGPRLATRAGRTVLGSAVVVVLVALVAVAWLGYGQQRSVGRVTAFGDATADGVTITFEVARPRDAAVLCVLRARSRDGAEVGRASVRVPAGPSRTETIRYRLATTAVPITGELEGCRTLPG